MSKSHESRERNEGALDDHAISELNTSSCCCINGIANQKGKLRKTQQLRWFQWEFLRRNPEYRRDFESLVKQFGSWLKKNGFWYERERARSDEDVLFAYNVIFPTIREICKKWQIAEPFSPDWQFDSRGLYEYAPSRRVSLPTGYTAESCTLLWDYGPVEAVPDRSDRDAFVERFRSLRPRPAAKNSGRKSEDPKFLTLILDVTLPQHTLMEQTLAAIRFHRRKHPQFQNVHPPRRRRRLDLYAVYLQVWDLRRSGSSFPRIASQIYPREYAAYPNPKNPIVQRVMDHYRSAGKLIEGGYKDLR